MAEPWQTMLMPPLSFKEAYERLEKVVSPSLHVWLGTDTANRTLGLVREQIIAQERRQRDLFEDTWRKLRLPSSSDITRVAGQIVQVEDRLTQIEDRIDEPVAPRAMPNSDTATLAGITARLNGLDDRISSLLEAMTSLESALTVPTAPQAH